MQLLTGVVEGFYGQPWTQAQRRELFDQLAAWGMNAYFYAPKDDLKHRALWRALYDDAELAALAELIRRCAEKSLSFFYGLSPGLDIKFSDPAELERIKGRFRQLQQVGAENFALLFDDLPGNLTDEDRTEFESLAAAQCYVARTIFQWLRKERPAARLLFCPTPYCDRMDRQELGGAGYLDAIGRLLPPEIDVLWTGPEIVSREIPVDSIRKIAKRLGRPPVIWDNLHANDYDLRRAFCGPYSGRSPELVQHVRGILSNPNNEFPLNYVPLRTLGAYLAREDRYEPRRAFLDGVEEWFTKFQAVRSEISLEDLVLFVDCFYLPHEEGPEASSLYQVAERLLQTPPREWGGEDALFTRLRQRIGATFESLTELKDRTLFYAWSRRAWELNEEVELIEQFLRSKRDQEDPDPAVVVDSHLPGAYRGGLVARLQRLLLMDSHGSFRAAEPES